MKTSLFTVSFAGLWGQHRLTLEESIDKVAELGFDGIEIMERYAERLFTVRYETLVREPGTELRRIAEWLDVEPSGFDPKAVYGSSVGNYRRGLTPRQLEAVLEVAGPTLERLGYTVD